MASGTLVRLPAEYYSSSSSTAVAAVLTTGVELVCAVCCIYRCAVCGTTAVQIRSDLGNGRPGLWSFFFSFDGTVRFRSDSHGSLSRYTYIVDLVCIVSRTLQGLPRTQEPRRPQNQKPPRQQFSAFCILDSTHHRDNTAARSRRTGGAEAKLPASTPETRYHPSER